MQIKNIIKKLLFLDNNIKNLDHPIVKNIKKKFVHSKRTFLYNKRQYSVDCIYCHACPGVIETCIIESLKVKKTKKLRMLNLGGGSGQTSKIFSFLDFEVFNLDIDAKEENEKNKKFDLNNHKELPYEKNFFDIILCSEVIEHIENPWKLFRDMDKVLKKGGTLILTTPNVQSNKSKDIFMKTGHFHWFENENLEYHINPIFIWELKLIAGKNGFEIKKILGNGDYFFNKKKYNNKLGKSDTLIFLINK